jgi:hypothetical protein
MLIFSFINKKEQLCEFRHVSDNIKIGIKYAGYKGVECIDVTWKMYSHEIL